MKITVCGAAGRMGQAIISIAKTNQDIKIIGALECNKSTAIGTGEPPISSIDNLEKFLTETDAIIDFTNPQSALKNLETAKKYNVPIVIGTTGFSEEQKLKIHNNISKSIPIVLSPNMSIGVNILFKLIEITAKKAKEYDIEIVELHHNKKKDSPSGTAVKLAEIAAFSLGKNIKDVGIYGRHCSDCVRKKDEIGIFAIRAGDIVGDHTIYFVGQGERIELTHRAHSRDTFAIGAIRAAKWLLGKKAGLYDMSDVLNLNKI
ncbi:MAG: 4-hydroxy-tetrahydrodipicolinate reductase [Endomicrobium sp.]|jgi:4-hydroxy-tetrahydrodipicolinate reductase|nr:4-hydroxy-tetrahydrodipicolinate reductase [Endomicrobium sp.]